MKLEMLNQGVLSSIHVTAARGHWVVPAQPLPAQAFPPGKGRCMAQPVKKTADIPLRTSRHNQHLRTIPNCSAEDTWISQSLQKSGINGNSFPKTHYTSTCTLNILPADLMADPSEVELYCPQRTARIKKIPNKSNQTCFS